MPEYAFVTDILVPFIGFAPYLFPCWGVEIHNADAIWIAWLEVKYTHISNGTSEEQTYSTGKMLMFQFETHPLIFMKHVNELLLVFIDRKSTNFEKFQQKMAIFLRLVEKLFFFLLPQSKWPLPLLFFMLDFRFRFSLNRLLNLYVHIKSEMWYSLLDLLY